MDRIRVKYGLIGFPLGHSFSKKYYDHKFETAGIRDVGYALYPLMDISLLPTLLASEPLLEGVNVTIPYKMEIMDYLHEISPEAEAVGAVNCVRIDRTDPDHLRLSGYNTDVFGFRESLLPLLSGQHTQALVLGNGGAAKAVCHVLKGLGIDFKIVSRKREAPSGYPESMDYPDLDPEIISAYPLIINATPLGLYPSVNVCPPIPLDGIGSGHLIYDLIYNPEKTLLMEEAEKRGASIKNGYEMLVLQAERNWEIWNGNI